MREYVRPMMTGETFAPNEYVAACYSLACHAGENEYPPQGYQWDRKEYGGVEHSPLGTTNTCGDANANRIVTNENGVITSIDEHNYDQGWINGGLDSWFDRNGNDVCDGGDLIYWHTYSANRNRRWNHWGYAIADPNHPNRS